MTEIQLNAAPIDLILQVASAGSVYNVCSNRAVPVMDMVRILLSLSPIGTSIVLRSHPDRFRAFDERILLVGKSRISMCPVMSEFLCNFQGDNTKLVESTPH